MTRTNGVESTKPTILVDLGGIFVHPPVGYELATGESSIKLARILSSLPWMNYEIGKISDGDCFAHVAALHGVQLDELRTKVAELRETVEYDEKMLSVQRYQANAWCGDRACIEHLRA
ncbi:hypothetical protein BJX70DRAFT_381850 [Aspergillus crustosus]